MIRTKSRLQSHTAFTIVELIVVIAVIGILAGIVIVSYGAWRNTTISNQLKSDLSGAAAAMESSRTFDNVYPATIPASFSPSDTVTLVGGSSDGKTYCIDATSSQNPSLNFYIAAPSTQNGPQSGTCATRPAPPSVPTGLIASSSSPSNADLSWGAVSGATMYTVQRASSGSFSDAVTMATTSGASVQAAGLTGSTTYFFRVQAANSYGISSWSTAVNATTPAYVNQALVTTLAGSTIGFVDGTGSAAKFSYPEGIAVDSSGTVYVSDTSNNIIRKITSAGVVTTLAGSGAPTFADGTGSAARFYSPDGIAVDSSGMVYVSDSGNNRIRKITQAGVVTTLAGSTSGFADGTGSAAKFGYPEGIAVDSSGTVYVSDNNNNRIRTITPAGVVTTLAGSTLGSADGTGSAAQFRYPEGIAVDSSGMLYVSDSANGRIRKITPAGVVTTLAGSTSGFADGTGSAAQFRYPYGIAVDSSGTVYVGDNYNNLVRKITPAGVVTTLAGSTLGYADGTGSAAQFYYPTGIAVDSSGTVYVSDGGNSRIRKIQ